MNTKVQVALDLVDIDEAIEIGKGAVAGGVDWIEVGTPLIKSEGISSVKRLNQEFPEKKIVADMKTTDTGRLEVKIAGEVGADVVSVFGASSNETIKEAVKAGEEYNVKIIADLMSVRNPLERALKVEDLGVDYIGIHTGIDQQARGKDPLKNIKSVVDSTETPIAIAGGLNDETAPRAVEKGASIIIVGKYITKSRDPTKASKKIIKSVRDLD